MIESKSNTVETVPEKDPFGNTIIDVKVSSAIPKGSRKEKKVYRYIDNSESVYLFYGNKRCAVTSGIKNTPSFMLNSDDVLPKLPQIQQYFKLFTSIKKRFDKDNLITMGYTVEENGTKFGQNLYTKTSKYSYTIVNHIYDYNNHCAYDNDFVFKNDGTFWFQATGGDIWEHKENNIIEKKEITDINEFNKIIKKLTGIKSTSDKAEKILEEKKEKKMKSFILTSEAQKEKEADEYLNEQLPKVT